MQASPQMVSRIPRSDLHFTRLIGTGHYGEVWEGRLHGKVVAIKALKPNVELPEELLKKFHNEVNIISHVPHPNIVQFIGICTDGGQMIVTEFLERGDAEKGVHAKKYPPITRVRFARDVALAMAWVHSLGVVHRDIKLANMLIGPNNAIKVCDFGLSALKEGKTYLRDHGYAKGTPLYMAPEVLQGQRFNESSDVYSFGVVLWELMAEKEAYSETYVDNLGVEEFRDEVVHKDIRPLIDPEHRKSFPADYVSLIEACWNKNPALRPTFDQAIPVLSNAVITLATTDEHARIFWKRYFQDKDTVRWDDFISFFKKMLKENGIETQDQVEIHDSQSLANATDFQLAALRSKRPEREEAIRNEIYARYGLFEFSAQCIPLYNTAIGDEIFKTLLAKKDEFDTFIVPLERFGRMLTYFGPIIQPNRLISMPDRIREIIASEWFHGEMDSKRAEEILRQQERSDSPGFLVRFSASQPGCFTISRSLPDGKITHERVRYVQGGDKPGFYFNRVVYPTLNAVINFSKLNWGGVNPCGGSPFYNLFHGDASASSTNYILSDEQ